MPTPRVTKTTRKLPVFLTDAELIQRGADLSSNMKKMKVMEDERVTENDKRKSDIKLVKEIVDKLVATIAERTEERDVQCDQIPYYASGMVEIVRCDTGEVIDKRPMTDSERQETLEFGSKEDGSEESKPS
jgi:hypothetical protein